MKEATGRMFTASQDVAKGAPVMSGIRQSRSTVHVSDHRREAKTAAGGLPSGSLQDNLECGR